MNDNIHETVRSTYAAAARAVLEGRNSDAAGGAASVAASSAASDPRFGQILYEPADRETLPEAAVQASLGCGTPTAVADLRPGERVLDLGSGGGVDVLLAAKRVGPAGKVYGLDMTEEMLALAMRNAADAGVTNVEFLKGLIEAIPLPAATIDLVISNCVINLAADKAAVFAEMARVLRPGGRIGISDIVAADELTPDQRAERGSLVGCIAGALSFAEYEAGLRMAGFTEVRIARTHQVADRMYAAIVRAVKPTAVGPAGETALGQSGVPGAEPSPLTTARLPDAETLALALPVRGDCGCCG